MKFWKMNGAGNDFIIINNIKEKIPADFFPHMARTLCQRHLSIGADGFMVVEKADGNADFKMLFFNSDGSMGEMCGNGARCICRYGYETGLSGKKQTIETTAGIVTGQRIDPRSYRIRLTDPSIIDLHRSVEVDGIIYDCAYVELGTPGLPHAVLPWPDFDDPDHRRLFDLGSKLRHHNAFPKGANVNFYRIIAKDLIEEKMCCYTLSEAGYIKRLAADTYRTQHRGGRGVSGQSLKEEDWVKTLFVASSHDLLLFFTNQGRVISRKGYRIPEASRTARGTAAVNILPLKEGEKISAMVLTPGFSDDEYLVMVTRKGTVKRIPFIALSTRRKTGIRAITLDEGDHLINVMRTNGNDNIVLATANGMAICFNEQDVRPMGRDASGVRGITLTEDDYVIGAEKAEEGKTLLTVTENGFGKRTELKEYLRTGPDGEKIPQSRGGKGLKNYNITPKTGKVAGCRVVDDKDDVMLIENGGVIIRVPAADINVYKRDVQGVIIMRIEEGNKLVSIERVTPEEEPEA